MRLYARVALKTLRISRTFGIEGRKLLTPGDDYEALRDFTHAYEGTTSPLEEMSLEYQKLLKDNAGLLDHVEKLPGRVFSSKQHPTPDSRAVFFCCALPSPPPISREGADTGLERWTTYGGATSWYLYDLNSEAILDEPTKIIRFIRRSPSTPSKQEWHS